MVSIDRIRGRLAAFIAAEDLPATYAELFAEAYAPLATRIVEAAQAHGPGFVVGVCGAQGSGKSTLAGAFKAWIEGEGRSVAVLSIDDFYLPREARADLAARVHPLLATRGPPGTHDVALAEATLDALGRPGATALPSFDKAADTRRPPSEWTTVEGPVDVILFEGWCVGARPQDPAALQPAINDLERERDPDGAWRTYVNDQLAGPYQALFARLDLYLLLAAPSFEVVLGWRIEQEHKLKARLAREGRDLARTMSDEAIAAFIAHYERLTRHILDEAPGRADAVVRLGVDRRPLVTTR